MAWEVEFTDQFGDWWESLTIEQQEAIAQRVEQLQARGPALKRPTVGEIKGSQFDPQMKELIVAQDGSLRVLFIFDPRRTAILLIGGDKTGQWKQWYGEAIFMADQLYMDHLAQLEAEGDEQSHG